MEIVTEAHLEPYRSLWGENRGPLVDTGTDILGRVYVAENEAHDILIKFPELVGKLAAELGWVSPDEAVALCAGVERAFAERDEALAAQVRVVPITEVDEIVKRALSNPAAGQAKPKPKAAA